MGKQTLAWYEPNAFAEILSKVSRQQVHIRPSIKLVVIGECAWGFDSPQGMILGQDEPTSDLLRETLEESGILTASGGEILLLPACCEEYNRFYVKNLLAMFPSQFWVTPRIKNLARPNLRLWREDPGCEDVLCSLLEDLIRLKIVAFA